MKTLTTATPIDLNAMTVAELDVRDAVLMSRFWAVHTLGLPYPRLNATMLAEVMGVSVRVVKYRCLQGTMPFPIEAVDDHGWERQYFASRADVLAWLAERDEQVVAA